MLKKIPENLNPQTKKKFEAIHTYDPYEDVITKLNQAFHYSYNHLIHDTHETLGKEETPVIIMFREQALLFHNGKQEAAEIIPALYHRFKAISHVSFGIFVTLANNGYGPLKDVIKKDLEHQKELIDNALAILDEEPIPANHMETQRLTLENGLKIIRDVLESGMVDQSRVQAFGKENVPLYMENAAVSAMLEIDVLHDTVMKWKKQIGPKNWENIYVVICAAHQARYRETTKQYFQRLFHEDESAGADLEDRVVYAEHINDVDTALDLLARHLVDQQASIGLFGDSTRLQQDLMSDGAAKYLDELLPK